MALEFPDGVVHLQDFRDDSASSISDLVITQDQLLIYCSIKFSVVITLNVWSGCFSEFSCRISCGISCGTSGWFLGIDWLPDLVVKLCRCVVDLRFQRTGSATM